MRSFVARLGFLPVSIAAFALLAGCPPSGGRRPGGDGGDVNVDVPSDPPIDRPGDTTSCDQDGDGYTSITCGGTDCNDLNPSVHPGATEICGNGIDDNCNGAIDEGCTSGGLVGSACASDSQCGPYGGTMTAFCVTQTVPTTAMTCMGQPSGFPNGFCAALCLTTGATDCSTCGGCPSGTTCLNLGTTAMPLPGCLPNCNPAGPGNDVCRDDSNPTYGLYSCYDLGTGQGVCFAGCYPGTSTGTCDPLHCASPTLCGARNVCCLPAGQACTANGACCSNVCGSAGVCS